MTPNDFERFLSAQEASDALAEKGVDISARTLADMGRAKDVPSYKIHRRRKFRLSDLLRHYAASIQVKGAGEAQDNGAA